jgi:hypothetical protein
VLLLELNEVNFDAFPAYFSQGKLPVFKNLIDTHGLVETTSEERYEWLEPWIQWVTVHTGLTFSEHGVFHLGDIVRTDIEQIWERLARQGYRVGAVSPMNAKCNREDFDFFVPDPWTQTGVVASASLRRLYRAICEMVNQNATSKVSAAALVALLEGMIRHSRPSNWAEYVRLAAGGVSRPWRRAMLLDQLLADVFVGQVKEKGSNFSSLFLNAGAHIQHHYMFNSPAYRGAGVNPSWYVKQDVDPLLEVYELYESIVCQIRKAFPTAQLIIATGLHQEPHGGVTYYWRLRDHEAFLRELGAEFVSVVPRMSRDFEVNCVDERSGAKLESLLSSCTAPDGERVFDVERDGARLFVMLVYPHEIGDGFRVSSSSRAIPDFGRHVSFVAIKNGRHNGIGYVLDTRNRGGPAHITMPLKELSRILEEAVTSSRAA